MMLSSFSNAVCRMRALREVGRGRYLRAIPLLQELERRDAQDHEATFLRAMCLEWSGDRAGASTTMQALLERRYDFHSCQYLAMVAHEAGSIAEAQTYARYAMALYPLGRTRVPRSIGRIFRAASSFPQIFHGPEMARVATAEADELAWIEWAKQLVDEDSQG